MKISSQFKAILKRIWMDVYSIKIAILLIVMYFILAELLFDCVCPFYILTGYPCAGCGLTRVAFYLFTGEWKKAIDMNLSVLAWVAFLLWFVIRRYIQGKETKHFTMLLILVSLITLIYYIYRMIAFFPRKEPMVYADKNILSMWMKNLN